MTCTWPQILCHRPPLRPWPSGRHARCDRLPLSGARWRPLRLHDPQACLGAALGSRPPRVALGNSDRTPHPDHTRLTGSSPLPRSCQETQRSGLNPNKHLAIISLSNAIWRPSPGYSESTHDDCNVMKLERSPRLGPQLSRQSVRRTLKRRVVRCRRPPDRCTEASFGTCAGAMPTTDAVHSAADRSATREG